VEDGAADEVRLRRHGVSTAGQRDSSRDSGDVDLTGDRDIFSVGGRDGHSESKVLNSFKGMKNETSRQNGVNLPRLDTVDRKIIGELLAEGRIPLAELGRRVSLSSPAVAARVQRLERTGVITGYRAEIDPRTLGYQLTAIVRIKPGPGQLPRIPALAAEIPEISECHRITGEDCFYLKVYLRSIDELSGLLDRFLVYGQTTTSIVNASPIPRRDPPVQSE
jgi:Lrp/AsnC family leucine-responsive transcriptional regulator